MIVRLILFLLLNFGALAIGSYFTGKEVSSSWYLGLNKAPWTPPGWVFGASWTLIMICFSIYLAYLWPVVENKRLLLALFALQWILNVAWNPVFFYLKQVGPALVVISVLTLLIHYFIVRFWPDLRLKSLLLLPYGIWLLIATSLNAYIYLKN